MEGDWKKSQRKPDKKRSMSTNDPMPDVVQEQHGLQPRDCATLARVPEFLGALRREIDPAVRSNILDNIACLTGVKDGSQLPVLVTAGVPQVMCALLNGSPALPDEDVYLCIFVLSNLAFGPTEEVQSLVDLGCVDLFIGLLAHANEVIQQTAIWGLGNIAGTGIHFRDLLLRKGVLTSILGVVSPKNENLALLRETAWALKVMVSGEPFVSFGVVESLLPTTTRRRCRNSSSVSIDRYACLHLHVGICMSIDEQSLCRNQGPSAVARSRWHPSTSVSSLQDQCVRRSD